MIDWVDALCVDWGKVMRERMYDSGMPPENVLIHLLSGRGAFKQHLPEVMMDWQLKRCDEAIRWIEGTDRKCWAVLWGRYVFRVSERRLAKELHCYQHNIRSIVDRGHGLVCGRLSLGAERNTPLQVIQ